MKFSKFRLNLIAALAAVMSVFATSCSDSTSDLLGLVPAETKGVVVMKPMGLMEKVDMDNISRMMMLKGEDKKAFNEVKDFVLESGIDFEQVVAFEYENNFYISFIIDDEDAFAKTSVVKDNMTKSKSKGFTCYEVDKSDGQANIVVDGNMAWFAAGPSLDLDTQIDAIESFKNLDKDRSVLSIDNFEENMIAGDATVYLNIEELMDLAEENGVSMAMISRELAKEGIGASNEEMIEDALSSRIYCSVEFNKDDIKVVGKAFDKNGKSLQSKYELKTIDADILRFLDKNSTLAYAVSVPDYAVEMYETLLEKNMGSDMTALFKPFLSNLDRDIAVGVTLSKDLVATKTYDSYDYYTDSYTPTEYKTFNERALGVIAVAKFKKDMSKEISDIANAMGIPANNGKIEIPLSEGMVGSIKTDGKYMILTNVAGGVEPLKDPGVFEDKFAACYLNMSKNSSVSRGLKETFGLDIDLTAVAYGDKEAGVFEVKINNNKEKSAIEYFIKLIRDIAMIEKI